MGGAESKRVQASRQVIWLGQFSKLERLAKSQTPQLVGAVSC